VYEQGQYRASAVKIALRDGSEIPVATDIAKGGMIAICHNLQAFVPERHDKSHLQPYRERRHERADAGGWHFQTSGIVALFLDKESAIACLETGDGQLCDPRWLESTKAVLAAIGDDHTSFYVSHDPDLDLLRPRKQRHMSRVVG
jgi:hypothetical protein